jgi:hypothetical protein
MMKVKFIDSDSQPISKEEVNFEYSKTKKKFTTDSEGIVEFADIEPGTKVTCYLNPKEKQKFVFEEGAEISITLCLQDIDMIFVAADQEGKIVSDANVQFEYLGNKIEKTSDSAGRLFLERVPVGTEVKVYQLKNGEVSNLSVQKCLRGKEEYSVVVDRMPDLVSMRIKLVEKSGQTIKSADVRVKNGNKEYDMISGHDGYIIINDIELGTIIECKQIISGRTLPWHKLKCDADIDEYIMHGERPLIYNNYSDKIDSQVRMKFRLVNSKGIPIPNAVLKIEYGDKSRNKYSNQFGETIVDDVLIGDKVTVFVDIRGKNTEAEFICQEDNEQHDIVLRTNRIPVYFWIIPLLVIIVFLIYLASSGNVDKPNGNAQEGDTLKKKDTVIISSYSFVVKNAKTGQGIPDARISLIYPDTLVQKFTDQKGMAKIAAFAHHLPLKYEFSKFGYLNIKKDFVLDSLFNIQLTPDDSVEIDPVVAACGSEIQSKGLKTSVKSFKMNMAKGRFNLWYNLFNIATKVDVYKGTVRNISAENLIYSNKGFMKGMNNAGIYFESQDSLITVCFESKGDKPAWVYKIYCAKIPSAKTTIPVVKQP